MRRIDEKTPYLKISLPHEKNELQDDLPALRNAFKSIDEFAKTTLEELDKFKLNTTTKVGELANSTYAEIEKLCRELDKLKLNTNTTIDSITKTIYKDIEKLSKELDSLKITTIESMNKYLNSTATNLKEHSNKPLEDGAHGFIVGKENQILTTNNKKIAWANRYDLCEFYYFRHPTLKPGFLPAYGGLIEKATTTYPEAWEYLQTDEGKLLCKTEGEWQAMVRSTWAGGHGWGGIGGAPFFVVDTTNSSLRLPDLRGMYAEAAGFDGLNVGSVHGDGIRNIWGHLGLMTSDTRYNGVFVGNSKKGSYVSTYSDRGTRGIHVDMNAAYLVPTSNKNQPRAWGALPCVYLGNASS